MERSHCVCDPPKLNRADYTVAKNYRPISLLECLGKLLEKVIAKIIYSDMAKYALVPTTQFGGRNASSTLDAGLTLLHDIEAAHRSKLRAGLLLLRPLAYLVSRVYLFFPSCSYVYYRPAYPPLPDYFGRCRLSRYLAAIVLTRRSYIPSYPGHTSHAPLDHSLYVFPPV